MVDCYGGPADDGVTLWIFLRWRREFFRPFATKHNAEYHIYFIELMHKCMAIKEARKSHHNLSCLGDESH